MNLEPLNLPVEKNDIKAFKATHKEASEGISDTAMSVFIAVIFFVFIALYMLVAVPTVGIVYGVSMFVLALMGAIFAFVVGTRDANKRAERGVRIERFAQGNSWSYVALSKTVPYPATLFKVGDDYKLHDIVLSPTFEAGRVTFTTGSGRSKRGYDFGYIVVPLEHTMPHIVLDGKRNNLKIFGASISNLPMSFKRNQVDLLEGDFNDYYTLYAPEDYGIDVRYIFTPDLMSILVNESDNIDIEIMDSELYIYFGNSQLDTPVFWQRAFRLYSELSGKLVEKSGRYADDRTSDGSVAPQGVRLKQGIPVFVIFIIVIYGLKIVLEVWADTQR